jgi:uncharacterized protein DUF4430
VLRRSLIVLATLAVALSVVQLAAAAVVHVRVEGKTQTIFGATGARVAGTNALDALLNAARAAEFYAHVTTTSFGPYIDQIGYYPGVGSAGWVFKVNGASPPVGADQVTLKDGDSVLWYYAEFGAGGGPETLALSRTAPGCYRAVAQNDQGVASVPAGLVFHVGSKTVRAPAGRVCPKAGHGLVWASAPHTVRSNRLP